VSLTLVERDNQHVYEDGEGRVLTSVGAILSVLNSYAGIRKAVLDDASDIGGQVHAIIKRLVEGDYIYEWEYLDKRIRNGVSAYERFRKQVCYKPRRAETMVANPEDGYAGTEDSDGDIPVGHIIIDWKTGDILPVHYFQVAAYFMAHLKTFPRERLQAACLVKLDKETGRPHPYFISISEVSDYYQSFLNLKLVSEQIKRCNEKEETWKLS
jgi:hypothetical protein